MQDLLELLRNNPYPGRGIVVGKGRVYYWIMGRSSNSRNRVFTKTDDGIMTEAHDPSKLEDPSLIIYHPVRTMGDALVVTNGDQTDTIVEKNSFRDGCMARKFEPDGPNFTPRISCIVNADGSFELSILKAEDHGSADGGRCVREFFTYEGADEGHGYFISTYQGDGNPLPSFAGEPVRARDLKAQGAMAALLKDALKPNLVQTLEGTPAFVHGGPFANIAHGCNSIMATRMAMRFGDVAITEAGFGADLGAEKFLDIKCRMTGVRPSAVVIVATARALKYNGGVAKADLNEENLEALKAGMPNLLRHVDNIQSVYGLPCVVAINRFPTDTEAELELIESECQKLGVNVKLSEVWAKGGEGGKALAEKVLEVLEDRPIQYTYPLEMPLKFAYEDGADVADALEAVATKVYRADGVDFTPAAKRQLAELRENGFGNLPVCVAKTQYSFSDNAKALGAPENFRITVRELKVSAGAHFVVALTGSVLTMPGLPKVPAAENIDVDNDGNITGLF